MLSALQGLSVLPDEQSIEEFSESFDVYQRNLRALAAYRPQLDVSKLGSVIFHLIRATDTNVHLQAYPGHDRRDFGWGIVGIPLSNLPIYLYEGNHYTVVHDSGVRAIGRIMQRLLQTEANSWRRSACNNFHFVESGRVSKSSPNCLPILVRSSQKLVD